MQMKSSEQCLEQKQPLVQMLAFSVTVSVRDWPCFCWTGVAAVGLWGRRGDQGTAEAQVGLGLCHEAPYLLRWQLNSASILNQKNQTTSETGHTGSMRTHHEHMCRRTSLPFPDSASGSLILATMDLCMPQKSANIATRVFSAPPWEPLLKEHPGGLRIPPGSRDGQ